MQKLGPFLDLLFYFDPKKLFGNNTAVKVTSICISRQPVLVCVCIYTYIHTHTYTYVSAEEKFMTQVTMYRLKVTSPKLYVAGKQVQFLHLPSFLIKSLTFNYYIGYLKTIL
jgi:hypothetical protein